MKILILLSNNLFFVKTFNPCSEYENQRFDPCMGNDNSYNQNNSNRGMMDFSCSNPNGLTIGKIPTLINNKPFFPVIDGSSFDKYRKDDNCMPMNMPNPYNNRSFNPCQPNINPNNSNENNCNYNIMNSQMSGGVGINCGPMNNNYRKMNSNTNCMSQQNQSQMSGINCGSMNNNYRNMNSNNNCMPQQNQSQMSGINCGSMNNNYRNMNSNNNCMSQQNQYQKYNNNNQNMCSQNTQRPMNMCSVPDVYNSNMMNNISGNNCNPNQPIMDQNSSNINDCTVPRNSNNSRSKSLKGCCNIILEEIRDIKNLILNNYNGGNNMMPPLLNSGQNDNNQQNTYQNYNNDNSQQNNKKRIKKKHDKGRENDSCSSDSNDISSSGYSRKVGKGKGSVKNNLKDKKNDQEENQNEEESMEVIEKKANGSNLKSEKKEEAE